MMLEEINNNPIKALQYMERMVNDGSQSGFTQINTTSYNTNPLYAESFNVFEVNGPKEAFICTGEYYNPMVFKNNSIYIHPDILSQIHINWSNFDIRKSEFLVTPTASSRTVQLLESPFDYIKLQYNGMLGRINREIRQANIDTSILINRILTEAQNESEVPQYLSFFPETAGTLIKIDEKTSIGMICRRFKPIGKCVEEAHMIIPAFSLFSKDKTNPNDLKLIDQIIIKSNMDPCELILNHVIIPVIDCYFYCALFQGIHPEMHSQNFLIGLNTEYIPSCIIIRDMDAMFKDITIRERYDKKIKFKIGEYKSIDKTQLDYKLKHSCLYDFRIGEYFITPLLDTVCSSFGDINREILCKQIKEYVNDSYGAQLIEFFPEDKKWYGYEKVIYNHNLRERPYIGFDNPKYR